MAARDRAPRVSFKRGQAVPGSGPSAQVACPCLAVASLAVASLAVCIFGCLHLWPLHLWLLQVAPDRSDAHREVHQGWRETDAIRPQTIPPSDLSKSDEAGPVPAQMWAEGRAQFRTQMWKERRARSGRRCGRRGEASPSAGVLHATWSGVLRAASLVARVLRIASALRGSMSSPFSFLNRARHLPSSSQGVCAPRRQRGREVCGETAADRRSRRHRRRGARKERDRPWVRPVPSLPLSSRIPLVP